MPEYYKQAYKIESSLLPSRFVVKVLEIQAASLAETSVMPQTESSRHGTKAARFA